MKKRRGGGISRRIFLGIALDGRHLPDCSRTRPDVSTTFEIYPWRWPKGVYNDMYYLRSVTVINVEVEERVDQEMTLSNNIFHRMLRYI